MNALKLSLTIEHISWAAVEARLRNFKIEQRGSTSTNQSLAGNRMLTGEVLGLLEGSLEVTSALEGFNSSFFRTTGMWDFWRQL